MKRDARGDARLKRYARASRLVALVALALLVAPAAHAYRTTQDSASSGITGRVAWMASPVPYSVNRLASSDLTLAEVTPAIDAAFATWAQPSCSALTVADLGPTDVRAHARDGVNVVVWEETAWATFGFPSSAIGVTNTDLDTGTTGVWRISGADMHLNGENFTWVLEGGAMGSSTVDVQSVVVHEAGHFLGLLHPCEATGFDGAPICPPLTDPASAPTMYPVYTGMTQRTLEPDDVDGICFLYPRAGCETTRCAAGETCDGLGHCIGATIDGGLADAATDDGGSGDRPRHGCCAVAGAGGRGRGALACGALCALGLAARARRRSRR